ncbi:hypothetical protein B0H15DRAFT_804132 [Mycena belliarum]|uniref:Uncharacterized protein n=1 Tax=Mycena belliarum TaxID=1033014 RepID=A0AAD6TUU5_9AGAR|nr:hypothetical protein B0H15DRAFT_804132 [Mycena belliae]
MTASTLPPLRVLPISTYTEAPQFRGFLGARVSRRSSSLSSGEADELVHNHSSHCGEEVACQRAARATLTSTADIERFNTLDFIFLHFQTHLQAIPDFSAPTKNPKNLAQFVAGFAYGDDGYLGKLGDFFKNTGPLDKVRAEITLDSDLSLLRTINRTEVKHLGGPSSLGLPGKIWTPPTMATKCTGTTTDTQSGVAKVEGGVADVQNGRAKKSDSTEGRTGPERDVSSHACGVAYTTAKKSAPLGNARRRRAALLLASRILMQVQVVHKPRHTMEFPRVPSRGSACPYATTATRATLSGIIEGCLRPALWHTTRPVRQGRVGLDFFRLTAGTGENCCGAWYLHDIILIGHRPASAGSRPPLSQCHDTAVKDAVREDNDDRPLLMP